MKQQVKEAIAKLNPAVNAYLLARTHAEVWRERMEKWDRAELARFEYYTDPEIGQEPRERVTDPKRAYLMSDADAETFFKVRQEYVDSLKIERLKDGECPALVASCVQRQTEHLLIETAAKAIPECKDVTVGGLLCCKNGLERYQEFVDLLVKLVVNAPGFRRPAGFEAPQQRRAQA